MSTDIIESPADIDSKEKDGYTHAALWIFKNPLPEYYLCGKPINKSLPPDAITSLDEITCPECFVKAGSYL